MGVNHNVMALSASFSVVKTGTILTSPVIDSTLFNAFRCFGSQMRTALSTFVLIAFISLEMFMAPMMFAGLITC